MFRLFLDVCQVTAAVYNCFLYQPAHETMTEQACEAQGQQYVLNEVLITPRYGELEIGDYHCEETDEL